MTLKQRRSIKHLHMEQKTAIECAQELDITVDEVQNMLTEYESSKELRGTIGGILDFILELVITILDFVS